MHQLQRNTARGVMFDHVVDRDESDKRASPGMAWRGVAWMCTSGTSRKGGREGGREGGRKEEAPFRLDGELHS